MDQDQLVDVYIAVGSNLGDRRGLIESGIASIDSMASTSVIRVSSLIETEPVGPGTQGAYLNGAAYLKTSLDAKSLLDALLVIEAEHGRDRKKEERWGARKLDLDILVFGDQQINISGLIIPHERMHERSFVLTPLCEIAADLFIPGHKQTPRGMLGVLGE
jgi:2-amino-4-hydroxy-6-hydroxymethyldihydropteridine diphosphokinase